MSTDKALDIRPSPIAGTWYPGNALALRDELAGFFKAYEGQLPSPENTELIALVVPHAGYRYSGQTAAAAFQALRGQQFTKVVVVSPSHRAYADPLLTSGHDAYQTPLGLLKVDHEALRSLNAHLQQQNLQLSSVRFDQEHALEIELPFLQYQLGSDFDLIPMMMLDQSQKTALALAQALFELIKGFNPDEKVLLVASTDLSHFHHQRVAKQLDENFIKALETGDIHQLYQAQSAGKTEACGLGPTATILALSEQLGANSINICDYRDSSYANADKSSVVGYVSAIIRREDKKHV